MITRIVIILLIALGLGAIASVLVLSMRPAPSMAKVSAARVPREAVTTVMVANRLIHAGELLRPSDLSIRALPASAVPPGAIKDEPSERTSLAGALMRVTLPEGALLFAQDLVRPGDHSYLAAVLLPGKRAISIGVDAVSGVAGLIWPGDHVDVILTETFDDAAMPSGHRLAAVTVLSGLRVIATDQDLVRGELPASNGVGERTITLEASPEQADRVSIASRLGRLSLSVCSAESCGKSQQAAGLTWASDVSPALANQGGDGSTVHIFNGATEPKDFHF